MHALEEHTEVNKQLATGGIPRGLDGIDIVICETAAEEIFRLQAYSQLLDSQLRADFHKRTESIFPK